MNFAKRDVEPEELGHIAEDLRGNVIHVDDIVLLEKNTRDHPERSVDAIAESIETFGVQSQIKLNPDRVCLKGNGTVLAARKLGLQWLPFSEFDRGEVADEEIYSAFDNRTGELSTTNAKNMSELLDTMLSGLEGVPEIMFDGGEIAALSDAAFSEAMADLDNNDETSPEQRDEKPDAETPDPEAVTSTTPGGEDYQQFAVMVTAEDRKFLLDTIKEAKGKFETDSSGEALVQLLRSFNEDKDEA